MNQELWDDLKDVRDAYGFSFKQAIFSGCQNPDSGVGVYAGSPDSYNAFENLFEPIISQYHKRPGAMIHFSDMNYEDLAYRIDKYPKDQAELIRSTRIRVARNLAGYPLGPGLSREQRLEIEQKVIRACNSFEGDLAGKYYSLATISEEDR